MKTKQTTEEKILALREKAFGQPHTCCPTCGGLPASPFRIFDRYGKVEMGCIDAIHTGRLVNTSESNRWHNRPEAKAFRRNTLRHLESL